jgi:hypothetical protein
MRWPCESQGAERTHFTTAEAEPAEDRLLPFGEERSDATQATRDLEAPTSRSGCAPCR